MYTHGLIHVNVWHTDITKWHYLLKFKNIQEKGQMITKVKWCKKIIKYIKEFNII